MKLYAFTSALTTIFMAILAGLLLAILLSGWHSNVVQTWKYASVETQNNILQAVKENLDFLRFSATSPPFIEPLLAQRSMPDQNYNPFMLGRMFDAYDGESGYLFGSFGMLITGNGRVVNNTNPLSKLSWQMAKGFGCPELIYAFSDASLNPRFIGHCAYYNGTIDWTRVAYDGFDWGLKPEEKSILDGNLDYTFLPIFNLLGQFTLTYEVGYPKTGSRYAVTFSEMSLNTFSAYVGQNVTVMGGKGFAYVTETKTGAMIATTARGFNSQTNYLNTVFDVNGTRLFAQTSNYDFISQTFNQTADGSINAWRVTSARYQDTGLDWTITIVVLNSDVYGNMSYRIMVSALISVAVILSFIAMNIITIRVCLGGPINDIADRIRGKPLTSRNPYVRISDLDPIEDAASERLSQNL